MSSNHPSWAKCDACPTQDFSSTTQIFVPTLGTITIKKPTTSQAKTMSNNILMANTMKNKKIVTMDTSINAFYSYAGAPNGYGQVLKNNF